MSIRGISISKLHAMLSGEIQILVRNVSGSPYRERREKAVQLINLINVILENPYFGEKYENESVEWLEIVLSPNLEVRKNNLKRLKSTHGYLQERIWMLERSIDSYQKMNKMTRVNDFRAKEIRDTLKENSEELEREQSRFRQNEIYLQYEQRSIDAMEALLGYIDDPQYFQKRLDADT